MRLTERLKNMKVINQDGQQYEFTPGADPSLIVRGKRQQPGLDINPTGRVKSKTVPMGPTQVGSTRG